MSTEPTYAFVDRRDPDDPDRLIGSFEAVDLPAPLPHADHDRARRFRDERARRGYALRYVAAAMGWGIALVSSVERRTYAPTEEEWQSLWAAIGGE
jgi:hypothetical protein